MTASTSRIATTSRIPLSHVCARATAATGDGRGRAHSACGGAPRAAQTRRRRRAPHAQKKKIPRRCGFKRSRAPLAGRSRLGGASARLANPQRRPPLGTYRAGPAQRTPRTSRGPRKARNPRQRPQVRNRRRASRAPKKFPRRCELALAGSARRAEPPGGRLRPAR